MMSRERSVVSHGGLLWEVPYPVPNSSVSHLNVPCGVSSRREDALA